MKGLLPWALFRIVCFHAVCWFLFACLLKIFLYEIASHTPQLKANFYFLLLVNMGSFYITRYKLLPGCTGYRGWIRAVKRVVFEALFLLVFIIGISFYSNSLKTVHHLPEKPRKGIVNMWDVLFSLYPGIVLATTHYVYHQKNIRINEISTSAADLKMKLSDSERARISTMLIPHMVVNLWGQLQDIIALRPQNAGQALSIIHDLSGNYAKFGQNQLIPLRGELDLVERYLVLLELKLGKRPCLDILAEPEVLKEMIIPMLIYLHVENMGKYAVLDDPQCRANIRVKKSNEKLIIEVENAIREIVNKPIISTKQGLASIQNKLKKLGLECTMTDYSKPGHFILMMVIDLEEHD
ncbi:hypothetical protein SAMN05216436_105241 [bacterium A37T11]|nr:hypothetical protein SAMN05216436_105241 [bacterium A37T11]